MKGFFGGLFMVIGGIIATLSGLCNVFYFFMMLVDAFSAHHGWNDIQAGLGLMMIVGGIPFAVGLFLYWVGKLISGNKGEKA